jgi:hypothetical protein
VPALAISAVLALPMIINLILHWPGDWGKYLALSGSHAGGSSPTLQQVVDYALWFWRPLHHTLVPAHYSWLIPLAAYLVAGGATAVLARGPLRRFLTALLAVNTVSSVLLLAFAGRAIDQLGPATHYICYFYWSAPAVMLLVVALAVAEALPSVVSIPAAAAAAIAACIAFALAPAANTLTDDGRSIDPALPHAVSVLAARSAGKPIVIRLGQHSAWSEMTGFLVQAERSNVQVCVADPSLAFLVTSQLTCTPHQLANGVVYTFVPAIQAPAGTPVLARLDGVIVTGPTG